LEQADAWISVVLSEAKDLAVVGQKGFAVLVIIGASVLRHQHRRILRGAQDDE
jgi:hypothetical protein